MSDDELKVIREDNERRKGFAPKAARAIDALLAEVERLRGENVELLAALSIGRFGALPYDSNAVIGKEIAERLNHRKQVCVSWFDDHLKRLCHFLAF